MTDPDVVVIGAGIIGGAVAHELSSRGWRTLVVDKAPAAGFGSTSASSAIVRFSYSTHAGVALAWEGLHYWRGWPEYLNAPDESGYAGYVQCGMAILLPSAGGHPAAVRRLWDELGIPYEAWSLDELRTRMPAFEFGVLGPPARPDDDGFWREPDGELLGHCSRPTPATSTTRNSRRTTCSGQRRRGAPSSASAPRCVTS